MPISGLVITFDEDSERRQSVLARLETDCRVTLGEAIDNRMPLVTEAASVVEARDLCKELESLEGVQSVAVVSVDLADPVSEQEQ